jgi:L-amino acid N-acyltransferase YncA
VETRPARLDDAEAIRAIYNVEVESSTVTFDLVPRSLEDQQRWIQDRSGAHAAIVAEHSDGTVTGFASLSPYRSRAAYSTSVEDSVYVATSSRGEGVGAVLLDALVAQATSHGFHVVIARIVGGHDASIALHSSAGFDHVGVEREVGRKFGKWLDVVVMQRVLA